MSFVKVLKCNECKKYVSLSEDDFPEDLYDLVVKYNTNHGQLLWICKTCKVKDVQSTRILHTLSEQVHENTADLKDIKSDLKDLIRFIRRKDEQKTHDVSACFDDFEYPEPVTVCDSPNFTPSPTSSLTTRPINMGPYKILERKLKEIKPDEEEAKKCKQIVTSFMDFLIANLKQDDEFKSLYSKPYYTGSSYNDLRISSATEYDIDIILKIPDMIDVQVKFYKESFAFAELVWSLKSNFYHLNSFPPPALKFFQKTSREILASDQLHCLCPSKVEGWFQSLIDRYIQNNIGKFDCIEVSSIKCVQSGPARTVKMTTTFGFDIDLDLVPVFCFDYSIFSPSSSICNMLEKYEVPRDKQMVLFVPKPLTGNCSIKVLPDVDSVWRLDLPELEKAILKRKGVTKPVIKLIKLIRDNMDWKGMASYYIKTVILLQVLDNPTEEMWKLNNLYERFMEALVRLNNYLMIKEIPCFFSPTYNLIYKLNEDQCVNWYNKLSNMIDSINSDYEYLNYILKVKSSHD